MFDADETYPQWPSGRRAHCGRALFQVRELLLPWAVQQALSQPNTLQPRNEAKMPAANTPHMFASINNDWVDFSLFANP